MTVDLRLLAVVCTSFWR